MTRKSAGFPLEVKMRRLYYRAMIQQLWKLSAALLTLTFFGCSTSSNLSAPSARSASQQRPGLATTFGESRGSQVRTEAFHRANPEHPWLLASIRYNDEEGVSAARAYHKAHFLSVHPLVQFGIRDSDNNPYPIASRFHVFSRPDYFVVGKSGNRYELVIRNDSDTRLEVVASVDGLDVLDGKPAAVTKPGYLVEPGKTLVIDGWRTSLSTVAAFRFGAVKDSYAEKKYGETRNIGVIGLAIFHPAGSRPRPFLEEEVRRRQKANPFPSSGGFAEPPPR